LGLSLIIQSDDTLDQVMSRVDTHNSSKENYEDF